MTRPEWVRDLVDFAAALAAGDEAAEDRAAVRLRDAGRTLEVEEVLLQSYLFLGFPVALEGLRRWRLRGVEPPDPALPDDWALWVTRGERTCRTVYGSKYEALRRNVRRLHPDLDRWMVAEGYGKVLARPALDLDVREICIVAMLVVLGARRQLRSHLQGALNAGVEPDELRRVIERAGRAAAADRRALAEKLWKALPEVG